MTQIAWTSPVTSKLLLEGSAQLGPYFWWGGTQKNSYDTTMIPVQDNGGLIPGLNYRSSNWADHTGFTNILQGSASYITGSHSAKFGIRYHANDSTFPKNYYNDSLLKYNFQSGVPYQLTMYADQASSQQQHQGMFSLYAQDRWTFGRLTLQGGLRFERLADHFDSAADGTEPVPADRRRVPRPGRPPQSEGPAAEVRHDLRCVRQREDRGEVLHGRVRHDDEHRQRVAELQPGRNRTLHLQHHANLDRRERRLRRQLQSAESSVANGRMRAPMATAAARESILRDDQLADSRSIRTTTSGWNKREHSWDLSLAISQQIAPRVSVDVTYNRRSWGNLQSTVNRNLTPDRLRFVHVQGADGSKAAGQRRRR